MAIFKKEKVNKEIVEAYNAIYEEPVSDIKEVLDMLSEEFQENYNRIGDAQEAYDTLVDENSDLMKNHLFVYNLSGESEWSVSTGKGYKESSLEEYINIVKECYSDEKISTLDDVLSKIERDVQKTMSNAGCDMFTALNLILQEDLHEFYGEDIFVIDGADCEARIEVLY